MERLTHRRESDGAVCPNIKSSEILTGWGEYLQKALEKLADYEEAEEQKTADRFAGLGSKY